MSQRPACKPRPQKKSRTNWRLIVPGFLIVAVIIAGGFHWRSQHFGKLGDRDTIVLADFSNPTGDTVFDDTL